MPLPVTVAVVAPAVPLSVTSPVAKPVTDSLKTTVKLIGEALVGSVWPSAWLIVTVGAVVSTEKTFSVTKCLESVWRVSFHWPWLPLAKAGQVTPS